MHRQGRTRYAVISPSIAGIPQDNFAFKIQVDITLRKEESCHTRDSARGKKFKSSLSLANTKINPFSTKKAIRN